MSPLIKSPTPSAKTLTCPFVVLPTNEWIARFAAIAQTEDISGDSRALIWRDTLPMIRDYWVTGVGMGAYEPAFYQYKNVAPMATVYYAHNDYLQYLAELGIVGFGMGIFVLGRCFYWMVKGLDKKAAHLGITRQSLIKMWIAEKLE